jgi:predicted SnoaL-like aldol condensation-catalyzing enzyme
MARTGWLLVVALAVGVMTHTAGVSAQDDALARNKVLAQRFHLDMIAKGDLKIAEEIIAPDCLIHLPTGTRGQGPERARQIAQGDLKAYPKGIKFDHHALLAEGNLVAFYWDLFGTRESGEQEHLAGIDIVRIEKGKIAEMWIEYHTVSPRKQ